MNHAALLDGSDGQDRSSSSHSERCAALKQHLHDDVLILESFDQTSRDSMKQDDQYNDFVNRFLSTFNSFPLPDLVSQVDQVIKNGLKDITASLTKLVVRGVTSLDVTSFPATKIATVEPRLSSASASSSTLPPNLGSPSPVGASSSPALAIGSEKSEGMVGVSTLTATIHSLVGTTNCTSAQVINVVNRTIAAAGGRVDRLGYTHQDSGSGVVDSIKMSLTCSSPPDELFVHSEPPTFPPCGPEML